MILIVGSKGNMGKRYCAACRHLGIPYQGIDIGEEAQPGYTHVIIATPIDTHMDLINKYYDGEVKVLCEKPIAKSSAVVSMLRGYRDLYMVNNWQYLIDGERIIDIDYDYYNTGKDGAWDYIQPLYLTAGKAKIFNQSPVFDCYINNRYIIQRDFDLSYVSMIKDFYGAGSNLWTIEKAIEAHKIVERHIDTIKITGDISDPQMGELL